MSRLKHPQIAELLVGQSLCIDAAKVDNVATLRASVSEYARRNNVNLSVHVDKGEIEIARRPSTAGEAVEGYITTSVTRHGLKYDDIRRLVEKATLKALLEKYESE